MSRPARKIKKPVALNWQRRGYFALPQQPATPFFRDPHTQPTRAWVSAFQHACSGDFRYVDHVPKLVDQTHEHLPYLTCAELLGDAGRSSVFPALIEFIAQDQWNSELEQAWSHAVAIRGRLGDIPALMDAYEASISPGYDDNEIILNGIAQVIDETDYSRFAQYRSFC